MQIRSHHLRGHDDEAVGVGSPGDLSNDKHEAVRHGGKVGDDDHLVRLGSYTHTLPGMPLWMKYG